MTINTTIPQICLSTNSTGVIPHQHKDPFHKIMFKLEKDEIFFLSTVETVPKAIHWSQAHNKDV